MLTDSELRIVHVHKCDRLIEFVCKLFVTMEDMITLWIVNKSDLYY